MQSDTLLEAYNYNLPDELIAQEPLAERSCSRLLVVNGAQHIHSHFSEIADFLPKNSLIVANNTKVIPARIFGQNKNLAKIEFLLLTPPTLLEVVSKDGFNTAIAECLLKPSKKIKIDEELFFGTTMHFLIVKVLEKSEFGQAKVELKWLGNIVNILDNIGTLPLPPYIKRKNDEKSLLDKERYQTLHSKNLGSLAAPTAGLHFTKELRQKLLDDGIDWTELCLHVGYGTFSPVREENIENHKMHSEYVEISEEAAEKINKAMQDKQKIIALGTTSLRSLEGIFAKYGKICAIKDYVDIFIRPGYKFQVVNGLITNFHLPKSSLIILVSALLGRECTLELYNEAVREKYRFFSYGDAMLILP